MRVTQIMILSHVQEYFQKNQKPCFFKIIFKLNAYSLSGFLSYHSRRAHIVEDRPYQSIINGTPQSQDGPHQTINIQEIPHAECERTISTVRNSEISKTGFKCLVWPSSPPKLKSSKEIMHMSCIHVYILAFAFFVVTCRSSCSRNLMRRKSKFSNQDACQREKIYSSRMLCGSTFKNHPKWKEGYLQFKNHPKCQEESPLVWEVNHFTPNGRRSHIQFENHPEWQEESSPVR